MTESPTFEIPTFAIGEFAPPSDGQESALRDDQSSVTSPRPDASVAPLDDSPVPPMVGSQPDAWRDVPLTVDKPKRGRPKGSRNVNAPPAPLLQVNFSPTEVSQLVDGILKSTTTSLGKIKPYLEMTPNEREGISKPLARWAVRTAPSSPRVAGALNKLDVLAAISTGGAYAARVGYARHEETQQARAAKLARTRARVVDMAGNPIEDSGASGPIVASQPPPGNAVPMVPVGTPTNGQAPYVSQPAIPR